jgi:hypothetical protein
LFAQQRKLRKYIDKLEGLSLKIPYYYIWYHKKKNIERKRKVRNE